MKKNFSQVRGWTLPFIAMLSAGIAFLVLVIAQNLKVNTHQMLYFNNMNRVYKLSESALSLTLGRLSINPDPLAVQGNFTVSSQEAYSITAQVVNNPVAGAFYIVTNATRTEGGKTYSCRLHTYASVANVGSYFAAIGDIFRLSPGMDARNGKIYAPFIEFWTSPGRLTRVQAVEYVQRASINTNTGGLISDTPATWVGNGYQGNNPLVNVVSIGGSSVDMPTQLPFPKKLPQVLDSDLQRYIDDDPEGPAHLHQSVSDFTTYNDIYPPGYLGGQDALDPYPGHTNDNTHHIYYSASNMIIGKYGSTTTIHGQVLFVSAGDIEIRGSIFSAPDTNYPGAGSSDAHTSSSVAHQAVFMSKNNVIINTNQWHADMGGIAGATMTVQGMFFCPNGQLRVPNYNNRTDQQMIDTRLCFDFLGAEILGTIATQPHNLPSQFRGTRTYTYMDTLGTHPPPYLPALAEIYYSLEEITQSAGLY
jgi:hypothetical protein